MPEKHLLVLSPWFPYPADNGSRVRIFNLIRQLSKHFRIRLVAGAQDDSPADTSPELADLCETVVRLPWQWHDGRAESPASAFKALVSATPRSILETPNPALKAAIAEQLALPTAAVLVCELGMDAYLPPLPRGLPLIMDGAEITGMRHAYVTATGASARLRTGLTWAKGTRYWRRAFRRYKVITAASSGEADALRNLVGANGPPILVIPNGVELDGYAVRDPALVKPGRLIYNGALTYGPNRAAVDFFVQDILPRVVEAVPEAHLVVTGRYAPESVIDLFANPRVELTGYLDDLRPALATAAICVVPLQSGGGTRLKILEAWGAGIPVVSTTIGAAGLAGAASGEHLLVADKPDDFAEAVVRLLKSRQDAERLAASARLLAESRYGWNAIAAPLVTAILEATGSPLAA